MSGVGAGSREDVEPGVAAAFGPLVVLLGQDGSDQAGHGVAVGEDADEVGAAADLAVEALVGVVGPDLAPDLAAEGGEREHVGASGVEVVGHIGELVGQGVEDSVVLGVYGLGVGLVVDRVEQRPHPHDDFGHTSMRFAA